MNSRIARHNKPFVIAHIVFRFDYGGLENGIVNVVNTLSGANYRHVVISLTEVTDFRKRLNEGVDVYELRKQPGKDPAAYWRLFRLLKEIDPDIVHTRNFGTLDCAAIAYAAGVPIRVHGEHGWDVSDPDGAVRKYQILRRILCRFVDRIVTVSLDLKRWIIESVGIPADKVLHIYNGVDTTRFRPSKAAGRPRDRFVVGSVTRFAEIKDPMNLIEAFVALRDNYPTLRLKMAGDGPLLRLARDLLEARGVNISDTLLGFRDDIPDLLRSMDVFVLGSKREGISNTVMEAMACGLPVIATDTGGNRELIVDRVTGLLVPPEDRNALAAALRTYLEDPALAVAHGHASRDRVHGHFSVKSMTDRYGQLYGELIEGGNC